MALGQIVGISLRTINVNLMVALEEKPGEWTSWHTVEELLRYKRYNRLFFINRFCIK